MQQHVTKTNPGHVRNTTIRERLGVRKTGIDKDRYPPTDTEKTGAITT
jgi:hypothetical protein